MKCDNYDFCHVEGHVPHLKSCDVKRRLLPKYMYPSSCFLELVFRLFSNLPLLLAHFISTTTRKMLQLAFFDITLFTGFILLQTSPVCSRHH